MITIGIDPEIEIGPLVLAWHGLMIAVGVAVGGFAAQRYAAGRGMRTEEILNLIAGVTIAGIVGARAFYLLENDPAALARPGQWLGTRGFSFYGAILAGVPAVALYLRRRRLGLGYLDALAFGFPIGMAVGRLGDVINGEHYGPASDLPWALQHIHPEALSPSPDVAYHSGGLYEVVLSLAILALVWPLRDRLRPHGAMLALVVGLYALGRFAMFFVREDSEVVVGGLDGAQLTSLALLAAAAYGLWRLRVYPRSR